jgi:glycosyltransferase involved in cell wall biosynthesis|tara:strand:- start:681 stop:1703 length:1023 start_codon:yes stop_codon:yes gene_type:complete
MIEMRRTPLVSILIPVYNAEITLHQTLISAINQTWANKEIIVVDDCSNDASWEIALNFKDKGVKIFKQDRRRRSGAARNKAIRESRGEYIQFLDSDDIISPDKIETQLSRMVDSDGKFIATCPWGTFTIHPNDFVMRNNLLWRDYNVREYIYSSLTNGLFFPPGANLFPRALVERAGPWDESLLMNEDIKIVEYVLLSDGILFCEDAFCYYRVGNPDSVSRPSEEKIASFFLAKEKLNRIILDFENTREMRDAISCNYQRFVHEIYPTFPEYVEKAERKARSLSKIKLTYKGSQLFTFISLFLGWKLTRKLELWTVKNGLSRNALLKKASVLKHAFRSNA